MLFSWLTVLILGFPECLRYTYFIGQVSFLRALSRPNSLIKPTFSLFCGPRQARKSRIPIMVAARKEEDAINQHGGRQCPYLPFNVYKLRKHKRPIEGQFHDVIVIKPTCERLEKRKQLEYQLVKNSFHLHNFLFQRTNTQNYQTPFIPIIFQDLYQLTGFGLVWRIKPLLCPSTYTFSAHIFRKDQIGLTHTIAQSNQYVQNSGQLVLIFRGLKTLKSFLLSGQQPPDIFLVIGQNQDTFKGTPSYP